MADLYDKAVELWNDFFPPIKTAEEVADEQMEVLGKQQNAMLRESWRIKADMARADGALAKAAKTRDKEEVRHAATNKVFAMQRRDDLVSRQRELEYTQQNLSRIQVDATCSTATLKVMDAVNVSVPDPVVATRILTRYQMQSQASDMINELIRETLETRREEREEARAEKDGDTTAESIERLTQQGLQHGNQLLLSNMPPINSRVISPGILTGSKTQMREQVREGQRRTDAFLATGGGSVTTG